MKTALILTLLLMTVAITDASTILLKNGDYVEGGIINFNEETIDIATENGLVIVRRDEVVRIIDEEPKNSDGTSDLNSNTVTRSSNDQVDPSYKSRLIAGIAFMAGGGLLFSVALPFIVVPHSLAQSGYQNDIYDNLWSQTAPNMAGAGAILTINVIGIIAMVIGLPIMIWGLVRHIKFKKQIKVSLTLESGCLSTHEGVQQSINFGVRFLM